MENTKTNPRAAIYHRLSTQPENDKDKGIIEKLKQKALADGYDVDETLLFFDLPGNEQQLLLLMEGINDFLDDVNIIYVASSAILSSNPQKVLELVEDAHKHNVAINFANLGCTRNQDGSINKGLMFRLELGVLNEISSDEDREMEDGMIKVHLVKYKVNDVGLFVPFVTMEEAEEQIQRFENSDIVFDDIIEMRTVETSEDLKQLLVDLVRHVRQI